MLLPAVVCSREPSATEPDSLGNNFNDLQPPLPPCWTHLVAVSDGVRNTTGSDMKSWQIFLSFQISLCPSGVAETARPPCCVIVCTHTYIHPLRYVDQTLAQDRSSIPKSQKMVSEDVKIKRPVLAILEMDVAKTRLRAVPGTRCRLHPTRQSPQQQRKDQKQNPPAGNLLLDSAKPPCARGASPGAVPRVQSAFFVASRPAYLTYPPIHQSS